LEPEGRDTHEIYVNGLSTSLPQDVQEDLIHSIRGLENAEIVRMGYAIEYDCFPPTQLKHSLETKKIGNLFLAGQINCTSGYEEAAGQGLMAGLNVIRKLRREEAFILDRSEAYIGVLIDDLVTRGTNCMSEPERIMIEGWFHWKTGGHLDIKNITLLVGSRYLNGGVPSADWNASHGFYVDRYDVDHRCDNLRAREVVSVVA